MTNSLGKRPGVAVLSATNILKKLVICDWRLASCHFRIPEARMARELACILGASIKTFVLDLDLDLDQL